MEEFCTEFVRYYAHFQEGDVMRNLLLFTQLGKIGKIERSVKVSFYSFLNFSCKILNPFFLLFPI